MTSTGNSPVTGSADRASTAPYRYAPTAMTVMQTVDTNQDHNHDAQHVHGGLRVTHLPTRRRIDPIYDAYLVEAGGESVMIANHGMRLDHAHLAQLEGKGTIDVLMSPFNRYALPALLGGIVAPGLEGLEALVEVTQPRHIVQTHDEPKHGSGLVPMLAKVERFSPEMAESLPWLKPRFINITDYTPVSP